MIWFLLPLIVILAVLYIIGIIIYFVVGTCTWLIFKIIFNKFFIIGLLAVIAFLYFVGALAKKFSC